MTKKHLQFCIYYMQVGDPLVAYKMTYPRAAVKSLNASVSRLMARPDVAEWVNGTEERVHNRMMRKFHNEHYDKFKDQLLTINQKRTVLTKIITGETKRVRYVQAKYGLQKIEEPLPVYAVLRAVDLDTRLENFYNYLTRSDTWRKTQNIYVNTPTLQQQVNILISQTTEKEEDKEAQVEIEATQKPSPPGRGVYGHSAEGGWVHSHRTDNTSLLSGAETHAPHLPRPTVSSGRASGPGQTPAQDTSEPEIPSPPGRGVYRHSAEGGWVHSREEIPPLKEVAHERVTKDVHSRKTLAPNTHESQTTSPLQGDRGTFAQNTREPGNTNPRPDAETPTQHLPSGPGQSPQEHVSGIDNTSPHPGDLGVNTRRTDNPNTRPDAETPAQHLPSGPGAISREADNTSPPLGGARGAHPRRTKTPRYLKTGPTTPLTKLNKTPYQLPGNTSGKTQPGGNHPPRESSS